MIKIIFEENDNIVEISDTKVVVDYNNICFQKDNINKLCQEYILRIIKAVDSWSNLKDAINDFERWKVIIQIDDTTKIYSSQYYSYTAFNTIKSIIEELISRCMQYEYA